MTNPAPNVMPSPRVPKATLLQLITTLSRVQVVWSTDPIERLFDGPGLEQAACRLSLAGFGNNGLDELRSVYDPVADQNVNIQLGRRRFTLSVRAESLDATLDAHDLCERIRFGLRGAVAASIYRPAFLSVRDIQPIQPLPNQTANTQIVKVAVMDIRWNWTAAADPLDPGEGGYIETVDGFGPGHPNAIIPLGPFK